jgi:Flp pilus assembly protein TadB
MLFTKSIVLALATLAAAHPGHEEEEHRRAIAARSQNAATKRSLENCAASLQARGVLDRGVQRRSAEMAKQRIARRIPIQSISFPNIGIRDLEWRLMAI